IPRAHGYDDSGRSAEDRNSSERRDARLPFPDRAHDADLRLRSDLARPYQYRTRPERADERMAQFVGKPPVESVGEGPGNRVGSRDRQADEGAGVVGRSEEAQRKLRPRAGDCRGASSVYLPGESECAVRSEERRVGKECRSRWSPYQETK